MDWGSLAVGAKPAWLAVLLAIVLGGCAGDGQRKTNENTFPPDYRTDILKELHRTLDDPAGIRDAYIAEPVLKTYQTNPRYIACLRFNARDKTGEYAGSKDVAAFFVSGRLTQILPATRELCGNAAYQPFPELQKLCRELVCKS
jgi:hypothetical protein